MRKIYKLCSWGKKHVNKAKKIIYIPISMVLGGIPVIAAVFYY